MILFGQSYFKDWLPNLADKDAALALQGVRCVEFGELDQLKRNELETTKAFITRQIDKVRPPYGRRVVEIYRQCVFFGTTNKDTYLKDDTGNRRFKPVEVGELDFEALRRDRDQLWAEALWIYDHGLEATLDLEGDEARKAEESTHQKKMVLDESEFFVDAILSHVEGMKAGDKISGFNCDRFKVVQLWGSGGPLQRFPETERNMRFAIKALKVIGASNTRSKGYTWWKLPGGAPPKA